MAHQPSTSPLPQAQPLTSSPRLAKAGTNVDAQDNSGVTPLMRAADRGDPERISALLTAGMRPRSRIRMAAPHGVGRMRADDQGRSAATALSGK